MQFSAEEIIDGIRDAILILDKSMIGVFANRSFYHLFHLTKDQTIGKFLFEFGDGQFNIPQLKNLLKEVVPKRSDFDNFEIKHHFKTIGEKVLLINGRFLHEQSTKSVQILLSISDITDKFNAQKNVTNLGEKYKKFVENLNCIILTLDNKGNITFFNQFCENLFGYHQKEVIGKPFVETIIPYTKLSGKSDLLIFHDICTNPEKYSLNESKGIRKDGSCIWISWSAKPVCDKSGKLSEILIEGNDITEIIELRKKLEEESARLKSILDLIPVGVMITNKNHVIQNVSRSMETVLDVPIEKLMQCNKETYLKTLNLKVPSGNPIDTDELPLSKSIDTGQSFFNYEIDVKNNGRTKHLRVDTSPIRDKQGNILGAIGLWQDLTDQIKHKKEHDRQRILLNQIVNEIPIGIALFEGPDFVITIANKKFVNFTGRDKDVLGKSFSDVWPDITDKIISKMKYVYETGTPFTGVDYEVTAIRENIPKKTWLTFSFLPFFGEKNITSGLLLLATETTEHILTRKALEHSRDQIQRQQTFYKQILNSTNVGIAVLQGLQLRFVYVNPTYQKFYSGIPMIGKTFREVFPDTVHNHNEELFINVYNTGKTQILHRYKAPISDRPDAVWEGRVARIDPISEHEEAFILFITWDVTEEAKANDLLKKTNSRFALLTHTAGELLQAPDPRKVFRTLCEKVMQQLDCQVFLNYLKDTDSGKFYLNAYGGITRDVAKEIEWIDFDKMICGFVARSGLNHVMENIPSRHDTRLKIVKTLGITAYACHPIILKGGEVLGTLLFGANNRQKFSADDLSMMKAITDQIATAMNRVLNEQIIHLSERKYRWLFDNALEAISFYKLIFNESGGIIDYTLEDANNVFLKVIGNRPLSELKGKSHSEIFGKEATAYNIPYFQQAIDSGEPFTFKQYISLIDRYYITTIIPYDSRYVFGVSMDITDIHRSQENARISEERLRTIFESGIIGIFTWIIDGPITDANDSFLQMLGYTREELTSGKIFFGDLTPAEYKEADAFAINELKTKGVDTPYEKELIRKDKTRVPVFLGAAAYDKSHHEVISFALNIAERKRLEKEITDSRNEALKRKAEMEAIFHSVPVAVVVYNKDGSIREVNDFYKNIFIFSDNEYNLSIKRRQKIRHYLTESGNLFKIQDFPISRALHGETLQNQIIRFKSKNSHERWLNVNVTPIFLNETLIGAVAGILDITEIKETEDRLRRRTEELANLNRELESFSYSVAHDLRNPLNIIKGYSELLYEDCAEMLNDECKEYIVQIKNSIFRMNSIIDDMLALSKIFRQEMEIVTVNLSELALKIIDELRKSQPNRSVNISIKKGLFAKADIRLMSVALGNILGNAWKYTSKIPEPKIEFSSFSKDGQIIYYVRDNGAGFDMSKVKDLFIPFKRLHTDKEFKGTGVGLAIVERAISRHGGKVWAEGEPGKGAVFYFTLQT